MVLAVIAAFGLWVASTRRQSHEIRAAFPSAVSVVPGLDVQIHGIDVGKVTSVEYRGGQALVGIGIDDDRFWPLHRGTSATIRFGTTVGNGTRRIDLVPGSASAPPLGEQGLVAARDTHTPVEFDEVFGTLDGDTRDRMRSLSGSTAATLKGRSGKLNDGIRDTATAVDAAGGLFGELNTDRAALRGLIVNTGRVARTLDAHRAQVVDLVDVAGTTFAEFAARTRSVQRLIELAPSTLEATRGTLARLDRSLGTLTRLVHDAAPGAALLPALADDAKPAVAQLTSTAPRLTSLLRLGRAAAPTVTRLLRDGVPFANKVTPILRDLTPMAACLRPYAPEIAGAVSNWSSFSQNYDRYGHFIRVRLLFGGTSSLTSTPEISTPLATKLGSSYAMPRPPGLNAGKPQFIPECGAGRDAIDPTKDPEDRR
ncbi:MAG: Virulence factor Mce family protein [Conexibacter sp.]|nr:Virulence factor Mce family protein [Conexibacter sp.]